MARKTPPRALFLSRLVSGKLNVEHVKEFFKHGDMAQRSEDTFGKLFESHVRALEVAT